ncbi:MULTISPECIES: hypothetical protein [Pseudonocardia]|nr:MULTISPECIES: hypothetical protein [Pseudonocardia]
MVTNKNDLDIDANDHDVKIIRKNDLDIDDLQRDAEINTVIHN